MSVFPVKTPKSVISVPLLVGFQARWTGFQPIWGVAWWVLTTLKLAEAVPPEPVQEAEEVSLEHIRYPKPWSFVQHPLTLPWHCLDVTVNRTCMKRDTGWEQDFVLVRRQQCLTHLQQSRQASQRRLHGHLPPQIGFKTQDFVFFAPMRLSIKCKAVQAFLFEWNPLQQHVQQYSMSGYIVWMLLWVLDNMPWSILNGK